MDNQVIVLIVVAAAGGFVLCAYSVTRFFFNASSNNGAKSQVDAKGEFSQAQYMREVRLRNHDNIAASCGLGRGHSHSTSSRGYAMS